MRKGSHARRCPDKSEDASTRCVEIQLCERLRRGQAMVTDEPSCESKACTHRGMRTSAHRPCIACEVLVNTTTRCGHWESAHLEGCGQGATLRRLSPNMRIQEPRDRQAVADNMELRGDIHHPSRAFLPEVRAVISIGDRNQCATDVSSRPRLLPLPTAASRDEASATD